MSRPHALLRLGFNYDRTLGMRRLTNTATDLVIDGDGSLRVLCRGENLVFIRHLSMDDDDLGAFNLVGGGGPVGGSFKVEGEFVWPAAMVLGKDGNLWLSDEGTHRVSVLTTDGELVSQWGEFGNEPGQMNRPSGIAHDPDGNVYLADTLNHRVQKFTDDGKFLSSFGEHGGDDGQFDMPWGGSTSTSSVTSSFQTGATTGCRSSHPRASSSSRSAGRAAPTASSTAPRA